MSDTTTPIFGLTKPEDGASTDTWGVKLNVDIDTTDKAMGTLTAGLNTIPSNGIMDLTLGSVWKMTPAADVTFSFTNPFADTPVAKATRVLLILNNKNNKVITWPSVTWFSGGTPTVPATDTWHLVELYITAAGGTLYGNYLDQSGYLSLLGGDMNAHTISNAVLGNGYWNGQFRTTNIGALPVESSDTLTIPLDAGATMMRHAKFASNNNSKTINFTCSDPAAGAGFTAQVVLENVTFAPSGLTLSVNGNTITTHGALVAGKTYVITILGARASDAASAKYAISVTP